MRLERGLVNAEPQPYGCELNESLVVDRKCVVSRRDPPTLFNPVEEPFDQVACTIEVRAEADGLVAIASRWNVSLSPLS
jgi:hypothetical protein